MTHAHTDAPTQIHGPHTNSDTTWHLRSTNKGRHTDTNRKKTLFYTLTLSMTHTFCGPVSHKHSHTYLPALPGSTARHTDSYTPDIHCQQVSSLRHVNLGGAVWDLYNTILIFTKSSTCTCVTPVWGVEFLISLTFVQKTSSVILLLASCAAEGNPDISDICFGSRGNWWKVAFFFLKLYINWKQCELVQEKK